VAEQERQALLSAIPAVFKARVKGVSIEFEERPSKALIAHGVDPDALSVTEREAQQIVVFLTNLHDRHGAQPGEFRAEVRRVMVRELADWAGTDCDF